MFERFSPTDAKGLVSLQAVCALLVFFTEENAQARDVVRLEMEDFFDNLTSECLDSTDLTKLPEFVAATRLSDSLYKYFKDMNLRNQLKVQIEAQKIKEQLKECMKRQIEATKKDLENKKPLETIEPDNITVTTQSLLENKEIESQRVQIDKDFLKTSLQIASEEIKAAKETNDEKVKKILSDITDATPGLTVKDKFDDDDLPGDGGPRTTNKPVDISNEAKKMPLFDVGETKKSKGNKIYGPPLVENPFPIKIDEPPVLSNVPDDLTNNKSGNINNPNTIILNGKVIDPPYYPTLPPKVDVLPEDMITNRSLNQKMNL